MTAQIAEMQAYSDTLEASLKINPGQGLGGQLWRDHLRFEVTKRGTGSRRDALHFWMRDLHPYLDDLFLKAYRELVSETNRMAASGDGRAGIHYENGLHILLRDVEMRTGFDGEKDMELDEPD